MAKTEDELKLEYQELDLISEDLHKKRDSLPVDGQKPIQEEIEVVHQKLSVVLGGQFDLGLQLKCGEGIKGLVDMDKLIQELKSKKNFSI